MKIKKYIVISALILFLCMACEDSVSPSSSSVLVTVNGNDVNDDDYISLGNLSFSSDRDIEIIVTNNSDSVLDVSELTVDDPSSGFYCVDGSESLLSTGSSASFTYRFLPPEEGGYIYSAALYNDEGESLFRFNITAGLYWNISCLIPSDSEVDLDYYYYGCYGGLTSDGNRAILRANSMENGSAVLVFDRESTGVWSEPVRLTATNGVANAASYCSSCISGDGNTVFIGTLNNPLGEVLSIFEYTGGWSETIMDGPSCMYDRSGSLPASLCYDGSRAVTPFGYFIEKDSSWTETETPYYSGSRIVGTSADISEDGNTVVFGNSSYDEDGENAGIVFVLTNDNGTWSYNRIIKDDIQAGDGFGRYVAISGDGSAILAEETAGYDYIVNLWVNENGQWVIDESFISPDLEQGSYGALDLSQDGSVFLIGESQENVVYLYEKIGDSWVYTTLETQSTDTQQFGFKVYMDAEATTFLITVVCGEFEDYDCPQIFE